MTLQNPGDIIYVPSGTKRASYAVEDSFSVIKFTLPSRNVNIVNNENEINGDSSVPFSNLDL